MPSPGVDGSSQPAAPAPRPLWPRACDAARLLALGLACLGAGAEDVPRASGRGDWYGRGIRRIPLVHLSTRCSRRSSSAGCGRRLPASPPSLLQAVSSHGTLFVHGRLVAATSLGDRSGAHNWSVNLDTGALLQQDPAGVTPNDWTYGFSIGTYGGEIYQADDGGPPHCSCDVWGPVEVSASERHWAVINQLHIDGPQPGIFCARIGANYDAGWNIQTTVQRQHTGCFGVASIAAGRPLRDRAVGRPGSAVRERPRVLRASTAASATGWWMGDTSMSRPRRGACMAQRGRRPSPSSLRGTARSRRRARSRRPRPSRP